jgi:hypothetical protein
MGLSYLSHELHLSGCSIVKQNEIDGNHLIVTFTLHASRSVIKSHILIDCGTTGHAFIKKDYTHHHHLPLHLLKLPRNLTVIDE